MLLTNDVTSFVLYVLRCNLSVRPSKIAVNSLGS